MKKKMKKRCDWNRKSHKREQKKKDRGIVDFAMIQEHFFKNLPDWINEMEDPRHESYITYTQADLIYMGILKNACSVESMRQMEEKFSPFSRKSVFLYLYTISVYSIIILIQSLGCSSTPFSYYFPY